MSEPQLITVTATETVAVEALAIEALTLSAIEVVENEVLITESITATATEVLGDHLVTVELLTLGEQGPPGISEDEAVYAKRVDFVGDSVIYRGEAAVGTAEASPLWRVRRITLGAVDGDVTEEWAGGSAAFNKTWTNRANEVYA